MSCEFCGVDFSKVKLFETNFWTVILANEQSTLGRSIVVLKRHEECLAKVTKEEFEDLHEIIIKLENGITKAFNPQLFNWSCLMNNAFKNNKPKPHLHWHCRPRYKNEIVFNNITFIDTRFGHHYDNSYKFLIDEKTQIKIIRKIVDSIDNYKFAQNVSF
ncbi:MAG: HIT family protein [bacterium]